MSSLINIGKRLTPINIVAGIKLAEMVCRPAITMSNDQIPEDTKKYTAVREFFTAFLGFITTLTFGEVLEHVGAKIFVKKEFGENISMKEIKRIRDTGMQHLKDTKEEKIKTVIILSSFVGAIIAGAIITPLLNNVILNKYLNKIIKKKDPENKLPESNSSNKEKNIFNEYNKLTAVKK